MLYAVLDTRSLSAGHVSAMYCYNQIRVLKSLWQEKSLPDTYSTSPPTKEAACSDDAGATSASAARLAGCARAGTASLSIPATCNRSALQE